MMNGNEGKELTGLGKSGPDPTLNPQGSDFEKIRGYKRHVWKSFNS